MMKGGLSSESDCGCGGVGWRGCGCGGTRDFRGGSTRALPTLPTGWIAGGSGTAAAPGGVCADRGACGGRRPAPGRGGVGQRRAPSAAKSAARALPTSAPRSLFTTSADAEPEWELLTDDAGLSASDRDQTTFRSVVLRTSYRHETESDGSEADASCVLRVNVPEDLSRRLDGKKLSSPGSGGLGLPFGGDSPFGGQKIGVVLFVSGTKGVGVGCMLQLNERDPLVGSWAPAHEDWEALGFLSNRSGKDDVAACALAAGRDIEFTDKTVYGRSGEGMITIQFNNPGYGPGLLTCGDRVERNSSHNPEFLGSTPDNDVGDDYCGPMAHACCEAALTAALAWLEESYGLRRVDARLIVISFSNGITCATGWMSKTDFDVHAFIDVEGPTDSFEQLVCAEVLDVFGDYVTGMQNPHACDAAGGPTSLASAWDIDAWVAGQTLPKACGGNEFFYSAYAYYGRPPEELWVPALAQYVNAVFGFSEASWWPESAHVGCTRGADTCPSWTPDYDPEVLLKLGEFWANRKPAEFLAARKGAYIRVNSSGDHVQPYHYHNRHAWRALQYAWQACGSGALDVYWADQDYFETASAESSSDRESAEPASFDNAPAGTTLDTDDASTFADHPEIKEKWAVEVDLARWALATDFSRGC